MSAAVPPGFMVDEAWHGLSEVNLYATPPSPTARPCPSPKLATRTYIQYYELLPRLPNDGAETTSLAGRLRSRSSRRSTWGRVAEIPDDFIVPL